MLINLRFVLRGRDVKVDQTRNRLLTRLHADAKMGRLAIRRADAAGLETHAIQPALLRSGLTKPPG